MALGRQFFGMPMQPLSRKEVETMKRILIAIAFAVATVMPCFAGDVPAAGNAGTMKQLMQKHPEMKTEMMGSPQHLLMMAYHNKVVTFGHVLNEMAEQGQTVPVDFARTAIAEMRRGTEEIEKYRAHTMRNLPVDMKGGSYVHKVMDQHLAKVKTNLRQLEDLAKSDRIQSQEVINHLQLIFEGCEGMDCGMGHGKTHHNDHEHPDQDTDEETDIDDIDR